MTDTIATAAVDTADSAGQRGATLEHLDPQTLIVDANVRDGQDEPDLLDAAFVANIKEHGVLVPIAATRAEDGQVIVRMGQRRTLAARMAGLATVPVYVRPLTAATDSAQLVERVTEQIVENDQRRAITEAQRARGIQQLLDAGISVTKVAQKLSVKKDVVKHAQAVGVSPAARTALDTGQLSLTEAVALAEFDADPDAAQRLIAVAGTARFDHVVAQLREQTARRQALAHIEQPLREKGFTVLDSDPERWDIACIELRYLLTAEGQEATTATITDPALWAVLVYEDDRWVDKQSREPVADHDIDWDTDGDDAATPAEGLRHANTVEEATVWVPEYYCLNYAAAGLAVDPRFLRFAGVTDPALRTGDAGHEHDGPGDPDDPDRAAARANALAAQAQAQTEQEERQRRERRKVLALNRLGHAAEQVRRDFVGKLLARKTPPKGAGIFTAHCLTRHPSLLSDQHADTCAAELLGVEDARKLRTVVAELPPTGDGRAQVIALGLLLGALENRTHKDSWRNGGTRPWESSYGVGTAEYLHFLIANGYSPSDVERVILGEHSADDLYDATVAANEATAQPSGPVDDDTAAP
jgi:ParB family chromosome partitioning protein